MNLVLIRRDAPAVALLVALTVLQLWQLAGPASLPENLDLMLQYVPNAAHIARSHAAGQLPFWNPYLGAGMPFAADPGAGAWYLPNWLLLVLLPLYGAVRAALWLHVFSAVFGTYAFCRVILGTGRIPALVGATAFALTTWLPTLAGMPVVLTSVSWLPWIVVLGVLAARRGGRWIGALALAAALQALSGWPAGAYLSWLTLVVYLLVTGHGPQPLARAGGSAALALVVAAILLLPAFEFVRETSYADTRPLESVSRQGYLTLLSWLRPAGGMGSLESSQLYIGIAPLLLALTGAHWWRRREARALVLLAILAIVIAMGTHGPLFGLLYHWLPGFRIVFLPARLGIVAAFALSGLAALGLQRISRLEVDRKAVMHVTAAIGLLIPVMFVQFWLSEGYDDFRRLLTNVSRVTGDPFLGRAQQAQYVIFGFFSLAALASTLWSRRAAPALFMLLTLADVLTAHQLSRPAAFDPARWYGPAFEAADRVRSLTGSDRIAGAQWHGTEHFLTRFPASADPGQLPPNLSLLTGLRDAQGYNPLLLRRATDYFATANTFPAVQEPPDDHWLWLLRFTGSAVDRLGVRHILSRASGDTTWRIRGTRILGAHQLRSGTPPVRATLHADRRITGPARLHVVSYLGEGTSVPSGAEVGALRLISQSGPNDAIGSSDARTYMLRAGEHTAEWAYGRQDVRLSVSHPQAPIALQTQLVDPVGGRYQVFEYLATFVVILDSPATSIDVVPLLSPNSSTTLNVTGIWLEPPGLYPEASVGPANPTNRPSSTILRNTTVRPRLSASSGDARITRDEPERVEAHIDSAAGTSVVLADTYYPGWVARVDGQPVTISPTDGLFREVDVPAGVHTLTFSYEPASFRLGAALSAIGLALTAWLLIRPPRFLRG